MNPLFRFFLACALVALGLSACARDCRALVERRCQADRLAAAACADLQARVAHVPPQACEAVLRALETDGRSR